DPTLGSDGREGRGGGADPFDPDHSISVDRHAVGGSMRFGPTLHQPNRQAGQRTGRVREVIDVPQDERSAVARVVKVAEVRLSVEEEHGALALRAKDGQRARIEVARDEYPRDNGKGHPSRCPTQPTPGA